ncbi:MAG TPA: hypothetical protein VF657_19200 [Actinoplanes sp.]
MILEPGTWAEVGPGRKVYTLAGGNPRVVVAHGGLSVSADALARVMQSPEQQFFMWLIYAECETCGVEAKQPCAGQRFGPHEGRATRWDKDRDSTCAGAGAGAGLEAAVDDGTAVWVEP